MGSGRLFISVSVVLGLILTPLVLLVVPWAAVRAWSDPWGNIASVTGLLVSVLGFALTIWTILETQRISRRAEQEITAAVIRSQQETRAFIARIGIQLLNDETQWAHRLVADLRQASRDCQWLLAIERCQQTKRACLRLLANPHLTGDEQLNLRESADELDLLPGYLERERLKRNQATPLARGKVKMLERLRSRLDAIQERLLRQTLEVPRA